MLYHLQFILTIYIIISQKSFICNVFGWLHRQYSFDSFFQHLKLMRPLPVSLKRQLIVLWYLLTYFPSAHFSSSSALVQAKIVFESNNPRQFYPIFRQMHVFPAQLTLHCRGLGCIILRHIMSNFERRT